MLLKWCIQNVSKYGKFSSSHRTEKGQFSFQSQIRIMPKNVQTMAQSHSFNMPEKLWSKSFNLQKYVNWKIPDLQTEFRKDRGARDEIANNCQSWRKQRNPRREKKKKKSMSVSLTMLKSLSVLITANWKILKLGIPGHLTRLLSNLYKPASCGQQTVRTRHGTIHLFKIGKI